MTIFEQEIREDIGLENQCLKKLDFIRNELIAYYGSNITLKELEDSLWSQYLIFRDRNNNRFKILETLNNE